MGGTCGFRLSFFVGGLGAVFEEKECRDLRVWAVATAMAVSFRFLFNGGHI